MTDQSVLKPHEGEVGDLIPLEEFVEIVEGGGFIDYDGMGSWATDKDFLDGAKHWVYPSKVKAKVQVPPAWATHVLWYNR